jgi:molecular chaperone IbpA
LYRITIVLAGFTEQDLSIQTEKGVLNISGKKEGSGYERTFLHQGFDACNFERRFQLADHVNVTSARLEHSLLHVDLLREIPDAMKPRTITIHGFGEIKKLKENFPYKI